MEVSDSRSSSAVSSSIELGPEPPLEDMPHTGDGGGPSRGVTREQPLHAAGQIRPGCGEAGGGSGRNAGRRQTVPNPWTVAVRSRRSTHFRRSASSRTLSSAGIAACHHMVDRLGVCEAEATRHRPGSGSPKRGHSSITLTAGRSGGPSPRGLTPQIGDRDRSRDRPSGRSRPRPAPASTREAARAAPDRARSLIRTRRWPVGPLVSDRFSVTLTPAVCNFPGKWRGFLEAMWRNFPINASSVGGLVNPPPSRCRGSVSGDAAGSAQRPLGDGMHFGLRAVRAPPLLTGRGGPAPSHGP